MTHAKTGLHVMMIPHAQTADSVAIARLDTRAKHVPKVCIRQIYHSYVYLTIKKHAMNSPNDLVPGKL